MTTLVYRVMSASREQIRAHLEICNGNFLPPLSSRVDLFDYSSKLFDKSVSFEAWDGSVLVGMLNAYFNDTDNRSGFITNVSILKQYLGQGIASKLLQMGLKHACDHDFSVLRLEVSRDNNPAKRLYLMAGFKTVEESGDILLMEYAVPLKSTN